MGYEVEQASDGMEVLEILQKSDSPKIAIVDWMMPKIDGVDLCTQIRKESDNNDAYII